MSKYRLPGPPHPEPDHPDTRRAGLFPEPDRTDAEALADCIRWWDAATVAVWRLIAEGRPFDAQHITEQVGRPYPGDGRRVAAFLRRHNGDGNIRIVDYRPTRRPTSGAVVAVWQPTDKGQRIARAVLPDDAEQEGAA